MACRQKLETCELWLRRLIHDELSPRFGAAYFNEGMHNGNHLFRTEIRDLAVQRMTDNPASYSKAIDTLLFDSLVDTLCKHDLYALCFAAALRHAFPDGAQEARTFLRRLVAIRNALSHANPISVHDAERVLCYCDDVTESLKIYYMDNNMSRDYNAPLFTRFVDTLGHSAILSKPKEVLDLTNNSNLRPGDCLRLEVEIDSSFDPAEYKVRWSVETSSSTDEGLGMSYVLTLGHQHVNEALLVCVEISTNRVWHRFGSFDARLFLYYKVLPPLT